MNIPTTDFNFGERVIVNWHEAECPPTKARIIGMNCDPRLDQSITFTIVEEGGFISDYIDEDMLEKCK